MVFLTNQITNEVVAIAGQNLKVTVYYKIENKVIHLQNLSSQVALSGSSAQNNVTLQNRTEPCDVL